LPGAPLKADGNPELLQRIEVWDARKQERIVALTNHLQFGATTIAAIYKDRWQIVLFFKVLKQNLKVKTFVGTSANALRIQLWTALIALNNIDETNGTGRGRMRPAQPSQPRDCCSPV
jgi:hypothetical protein